MVVGKILLGLAQLTLASLIIVAENCQVGINFDTSECALLTETETGWVRGIQIESQTGKDVGVYFGIPYALPPIGSRRFRSSEPVAKWDGVFKAHTPPLPCHQASFESPDANQSDTEDSQNFGYGFMVPLPHSEDCLKLNVYVPIPKPEKAPVSFYLHGGGFYGGSSVHMFTNGSNLAAEEGLIFVSVNYRLGVLGFLSLGNEGANPEAPGNVGIGDQKLALRWLRENIGHFGGNPDDITLVGASAGAASVAYHLASQDTRELFRKAVFVGGGPLNPWTVNDKDIVVRKSIKVAQKLGFQGDETNVSAMVEFLRTQTPEDLISANEVAKFLAESNIGPIKDGTLIPYDLENEIRKVENFSVIIRTASDEMGWNLMDAYPELFQNNEDGRISLGDYQRIVADLNPVVFDHRIASVLTKAYIDNFGSNDSSSSAAGVVDVQMDLVLETASDYSFVCPSDRLADILAEKNNQVYRSVFDVKAEIFSDWFPKWMTGAPHASDPLAFMGVFLNSTDDRSYVDFSYRMMNYFASFARSGSLSPLDWPSYDGRNRATRILRAGKKSITLYHPNAVWCSFWRHLVPLAIKMRQCSLP